MAASERIQIQLALSYKQQPAEHPRIRTMLERGYRVVSVDRLNDREALITLEPSPVPTAS